MYLDQLNLGVAITHRPEPTRIPTFFNYAARKHWVSAVQTALAQSSTASSPRTLWKLAVFLFVQECKEAGIPFRASNSTSANTQVVQHLFAERKRIVKFLQDTGLLLQCKVRTGVRSVKIRNGKFILTVDAKIDYNRSVDALVYKHFRYRRKLKAYSSQLSKHTTISVYNESAGMNHRWHLTYSVSCPLLPVIKSKPLAEQYELETLIFMLWNKIALYTRPSLLKVSRSTRLHTI